MEELLKIDESIRIIWTARDKATGHLRFESHGMTLDEAAEFVEKEIDPTRHKYNWTASTVVLGGNA